MLASCSQVKSSFVKERVNEQLSELYEQLRVENVQLKSELAVTQKNLTMAEYRLSTIQGNYETLMKQKDMQIASH